MEARSLIPVPRPQPSVWLKRLSIAAIAVCLSAAVSIRQASADDKPYHSALDPSLFPVPESLVPNVEFWRAVFSRYDSTQTVIHDNRHLDVVFAVVDVRDLLRADRSAVVAETAMRDRVEREVEKYQKVLRRLAGDLRATADPDDVERVRRMYAQSARRATDYSAAVNRVRGQRGLKDRFAEAIQTSGLFMPGIERILARHGLPAEIRCLPFVESMFNYRARSKVGASGVWQFTAETGRRYLRIDSTVDARHDVWLAADAAARMLASHHARVKSWPLALTGYNHGIAGMARAQQQLRTSDIGIISDRYQSPSFGFASRNFYSEFVAAVTVFADRARLFPGIEPLPPRTFEEFTLERFVSLLDLAHLTDTDAEVLADLNPALVTEVTRGERLVPSGYPLRVPSGSKAAFQRAFARLPVERKPDRQPSLTHVVARGDTLSGLARRYGTTVDVLRKANNLSARSTIRIGQVLSVGAGRAWAPLVWSPPAIQTASAADRARVHIVRAGETLYQIASQYGLPLATLLAANELVSPDRLLVGMQIAIPIRGGIQ